MKYPKMEYKVSQSSNGIVLKFKTDKELLEGVEVWQTEADNKDFRKCEFKPTKVNGVAHSKCFKVAVDYPQSGFKAFVVILKYRHPSKPNATYNITTRMFTADSDELFDEAFELPLLQNQ